jgi:hypothetical protein
VRLRVTPAVKQAETEEKETKLYDRKSFITHGKIIGNKFEKKKLNLNKLSFFFSSQQGHKKVKESSML